ncbi:MAG TPA: cupin domain-containing protein [Pyrinomonadaceae bacterium]|nr:cupin domain-containing protein [Pyrinomonadaceae bacterium]
MKRVYILILVLLATGFVRSDASTAQDPVKVNAKHITVKVDNPRVRVFEAVLKPGEKENVHTHPATVVYVVEGGKLRNYASDGATSEVELKAGDTLYRDPLTHSAENIGNTTLRLVVVELKNQ